MTKPTPQGEKARDIFNQLRLIDMIVLFIGSLIMMVDFELGTFILIFWLYLRAKFI